MSPARKKPVKRKAKPVQDRALYKTLRENVATLSTKVLGLEKRVAECAYDIARVEDKHRADAEAMKAQLVALEGRPPPRVALEGPLNLGPSEFIPAPEGGQGGSDFQELSTEGAAHGE